jgi:phosphatidylinositol alpha-1,6-mannosyltransferase
VIVCGHLFMAPLALLLARLTGAKLVIQTHGIEIWRTPTRLQRAALERAELVLSVSRFTRAQVLTRTCARPERVVVIPNTVGEVFVPGDGSEVRRRLGLAGRKMLLSLSRLDARERYKGQDRIIPLIRPLVENGHDAVFVVVGEGDDRPRLESLAHEHEVADRVIFLGAVRDEDRTALYRAADLYVMPSTGEGFGISFLEAMACGAPAVGLNAGGAPDALCGGELGAACAENQLLPTIESALRKPLIKGRSLAQRVTARFGPDAFRTRVEQVVEAFL